MKREGSHELSWKSNLHRNSLRWWNHMQEGIEDVDLVESPPMGDGYSEVNPDWGRLHERIEGCIVIGLFNLSHPILYELCFQALYWSVGWCLMHKIHLQLMTLSLEEWGIRVHMLFLTSTLYSSFIVDCHAGMERVDRMEFRTEIVVTAIERA